MIDLHSHILPGIDDGPATIEESVELGRAAAVTGTKTIVATPHVSHSYPNDPETIARLVDALNERLRDEQVELEVLPGAEVAMTSVVKLDSEILAGFTLGASSCLLVEPPFSTIITGFDAVVLELMHRGYRVLVAHPERCPAFHRDSAGLAALVGEGALTSITAGSLTGRFGSQVRRVALRLVTEGLVHNVASDTHDVQRRPPSMGQEIEQSGLQGLADWLTRAVPCAILLDEPIPPMPPIGSPNGRGIRALLGRLRNR